MYDAKQPSTEEPNPPTTQQPIDEGTTDPSEDGELFDDSDDFDDDEIDLEEDQPQKPTNHSNAQSSIGSLRSPGSAKTGDATPIVALSSLFILSISGFVLLRKKAKER